MTRRPRAFADLATAIPMVRALLVLSRMHPALQPYLDPKPVRTWRYVLAGVLVGLLASRVVLALALGAAS